MTTTATTEPTRPQLTFLRRWPGALIAAASGLLLPFAFAPFDLPWLAPIALAGLYLSWYGVGSRAAALRGFLFGFCAFVFGVHWIYISVGVFSPAPAALAVALTVGLAAVMALYPAGVGWVAARWLNTRGAAAWLLALPALWVGFEWLRAWFLTGFGWLSLGYSQTDTWLAGIAPLAGLHGVSFAIALLAGAIVAAAVGHRREKIAAVVTGVCVLGVSTAVHQRQWTTPKGDVLTAALVQGSVSQDQKWLPEQLPVTMDLYRNLTSTALGADLIVWPEAAIPQLYEYMGAFLDRVGQEAAAAGSTVMLGMLKLHPPTQTAQNAVFALGHPELVYIKRHLVPYGEYFPVPDFVRRGMRALSLPNIDTTPGDPGQAPFDLLGERIAITICYEDVFGAEQLGSFPEATLMVNVSNDAWFGESIAADQHLQIARMRSLEVGRYQLRSTNTGLTAVIDPFGRVTAALRQFDRNVLRAEVRGYEGATPYVTFGNAAILLVCALSIAAYAAITKFTMRPGT